MASKKKKSPPKQPAPAKINPSTISMLRVDTERRSNPAINGEVGIRRSIKFRFAIVAARFNDFITKRLVNGAISEFARHGITEKDLTIVWVPGVFEIPLTALKLAQKKNVDAVLCLGAVIKGETLHFDLVARESARGIMQVSLTTGKPVIFEVLSTYTVDQAYKRSEAGGKNKGKDAVLAALDMTGLLRLLK